MIEIILGRLRLCFIRFLARIVILLSLLLQSKTKDKIPAHDKVENGFSKASQLTFYYWLNFFLIDEVKSLIFFLLRKAQIILIHWCSQTVVIWLVTFTDVLLDLSASRRRTYWLSSASNLLLPLPCCPVSSYLYSSKLHFGFVIFFSLKYVILPIMKFVFSNFSEMVRDMRSHSAAYCWKEKTYFLNKNHIQRCNFWFSKLYLFW